LSPFNRNMLPGNYVLSQAYEPTIKMSGGAPGATLARIVTSVRYLS
jgi:hypothetical protein